MNDPLVLLPGMMCDGRVLLPQIAALSTHRAVMVAPLNAHDNFRELCRDVLASAPRRFALGGVSMGGIAAMEIIRQAPERVSRLALLDTNPLSESAERRKLREPQIESVRAGNLQAVMRNEMKPNYLSDRSDRKTILEICMDMALSLGPEVFVRQSRALQSRSDQTPTLKAIKVPTLVLCGEDDRLCPVAAHQRMSTLIPDSTLVVIPGAGHLPTLEQPELTNEALERWLNQ